MNCKECGYIKDEYEERMTYCDKIFSWLLFRR